MEMTNGDGENPYALGQGARHQENQRGQFAHALAEPAPHQLVRREHLAAEVVRQQQHGNHDAGQQVAEDDLQESQVAGEGQGRRAHDGQGAGFGGDDGKADGPPGGGSATQEVVAQALSPAAEARAEPGDGHQVEQDHPEIEVAHAVWEF